MGSILAVDAGLRAGLALFSPEGSLMWYRSSNFGTLARLRQGAYSVLKELHAHCTVAIEGGGPHADAWQREALRQGHKVLRVSAEQWRSVLMPPRHQRSGAEAKRRAGALARKAIESSGAKRPTSLRHDAAEAILIGLWTALELGRLRHLPEGFE